MSEWIEWAGGERPVPFGETIHVRHRDGQEYADVYAGFFGGRAASWLHVGGTTDIVAYRRLGSSDPIKVPEHYNSLRAVLNDAFSQASSGKGSERHASGQPFEQQPILSITREEGLGFPIGQAKKKAGEAHRMADRGEHAAAERDLLGAIVYLAAAILRIREKQA